MKEDIYSVSEGRLVIQWPSPLSKESAQEIIEFLNLVHRKIVRDSMQSESDADPLGEGVKGK